MAGTPDKKLKLKICGMRDSENIKTITTFQPDYFGFIFYERSPRFIGEMDFQVLNQLPSAIKKVGVFVNPDFDFICENIRKYQLDLVQLHGTESPDFCQNLKEKFEGKIEIIKAFSVGENFDFSILKPYETYCDFFLFDTKGKNYGGNGVIFNWDLLENYKSELPFFLSGGIELNHVQIIKNLKLPQLFALDINSRFEISPALKDVDKIKKFVNQLWLVGQEPNY
ncbi:MAG: phosphoribosylanthranilate isomerase [Flammeovirgaceae bacterium]|nr:phosphoribosylanthranilate isomerase [Flammeovirgaceae bacterium]